MRDYQERFEKMGEKARDDYMRQALRQVTEDAPWIWVVHDLNLRVLSPKVKNFVQPQSWYVDLTGVTVE